MRYPIFAMLFGLVAILPPLVFNDIQSAIGFAAMGIIYAIMYLTQTVAESRK